MALPGLADRLRFARELGRLSQRELTRRAGLKSERHVGLIESGEKADVMGETAEKLSRVLGVSLDWLLTGKGEPPTEESVRAALNVSDDAPDSTRTSTAPDPEEQAS
jgi:transcriptional regulator with XRE-family HTH domain